MAMKTLALATALCLIPTVAFSQTPPTAAAVEPPRTPVRYQVIDIRANPPRPWSWIFARSALHYAPVEPRPSFTPTVVQAVRRNPF